MPKKLWVLDYIRILKVSDVITSITTEKIILKIRKYHITKQTNNKKIKEGRERRKRSTKEIDKCNTESTVVDLNSNILVVTVNVNRLNTLINKNYQTALKKILFIKDTVEIKYTCKG